MSLQRLPVRRGRPTPPPPRSAELCEPIMSVELSIEGRVTVLAVAGEVDMSNAHLIVELAEAALRERPDLVLDLSAVTFFGAHGISALLRVQAAAARAGGSCVLRSPSAFVQYVLAVSGVIRGHQDGSPGPKGICCSQRPSITTTPAGSTARPAWSYGFGTGQSTMFG